MSYVTQQDLIDRFGEAELVQVTDRTGGGVIDALAVSLAIGDINNRIASYLRGRYQLPIDPPPPELAAAAADMVRYRLYDDAPTDQVRQRHDDAMRFLREIAEGKAELDLTTATATAGGDAPDFVSPDPTFTDDALGGL